MLREEPQTLQLCNCSPSPPDTVRGDLGSAPALGTMQSWGGGRGCSAPCLSFSTFSRRKHGTAAEVRALKPGSSRFPTSTSLTDCKDGTSSIATFQRCCDKKNYRLTLRGRTCRVKSCSRCQADPRQLVTARAISGHRYFHRKLSGSAPRTAGARTPTGRARSLRHDANPEPLRSAKGLQVSTAAPRAGAAPGWGGGHPGAPVPPAEAGRSSDQSRRG